ncbi:MAG TPA: ceramide glucosyltransferase [Xanthobacteraceae bacterium]|nr:ceramide glucosyltransferase [Xanthobacteraceae bacterium]
MTAPILAATVFCVLLTAVQTTSIAIAILRLRRKTRHRPSSAQHPPVSLVRPLCGIDNYVAETLRSTFELDYRCYEILFCVARASDPVLPLVKGLIAAHPNVSARLLIGDDRVSTNPKLNNVVKGWRAALHPWIIIADSNVLMPHDYIQRLFASWRTDTGLVASPPIAARPHGFWAEIECAFLNTYQARWQYIVDSFGRGFAQGKTMLWRREDLERAGGIEALGKEVAEDAAATKIVRGAGLKVRLVDRPLAQPLGRRSASEVWHRQLRWARLRRASFFIYFLPEIVSGGVLPITCAAILASTFGWPALLCAAGFGAIWYGGEMALAAAAGWHVSPLHPLYGLLRDLMLPALFVGALRGNDFVWRGNAMQVEQMRLVRIAVRLRPRMHELAVPTRKRLRALRAPTS